MKNYIKPEITNVNFSANCNIASSGLTGWLEDNAGVAEFNEVITTFAYNS